MATNLDQSNNLVIGNGVSFKGTLNVPKKATVYGTIDGELTAEEIFIGQSGKITGKVTARSIEVEGELHQVIHCRDHLHIRASGKVSGKLEYSQIQIERGGEFRGEMQQVGAPMVVAPSSGSSFAPPKPAMPLSATISPNPAAPAGNNNDA
jgi:cytoskeletal protein CcmA (bactofilin family)